MWHFYQMHRARSSIPAPPQQPLSGLNSARCQRKCRRLRAAAI